MTSHIYVVFISTFIVSLIGTLGYSAKIMGVKTGRLKKENLYELRNFRKMPRKVILLNTIAFSVSSISVLASLYDACLSPNLRTTCILPVLLYHL